MESIPDMDDLLDEIENSLEIPGRSTNDYRNPPSFQSFTPPQILSTITNGTPRFLEPTPEPVPSQNKAMESPKTEEDEVKEEPLPALEIVPSEEEEQKIVEENLEKLPEVNQSDFDDALERYLDQCQSDSEEPPKTTPESLPKEDQSIPDDLIQAAECVANDIVANVISGRIFHDIDDIYLATPPDDGFVEEEPIPEVISIAQEPLVKEPQVATEEIQAEITRGEIPDEPIPEEIPDEIIEISPIPETVELSLVELVDESAEVVAEEEEEGLSEPSGSVSEEGLEAEEESTPSIATIHNLDQESSTHLTESELQLGKKKPYWIPDGDCDSCMLCSTKFSLIIRRHHCRACGRVLCSSCCSARTMLDYMKSEEKPTPARVCQPCVVTLSKIAHFELERDKRSSGSSSARRGVLKSRSEHEELEQPSTSETTPHKRSVTFRDGVNPGSSSGTPGESERSTAMKPKKKSRKRSSIVRRVTELKLEDELTSYLPATAAQPLTIRQADKTFAQFGCDHVTERLKDGYSVSLLVRKNLICVIQPSSAADTPIWSIMSEGFASIGMDEVLFVWKRQNEVSIAELLVVLERISSIYRNILCVEGNSSGVQQVVSRFPRIQTVSQAIYPLPKHIYFYRPTIQIFGEIRVPTSPFLVACFLAESELSWMMACPNRVLFRLGLKYGSYPYPFVNYPEREAVFTNETSSTVLKVFTDFRNWSFRMATVCGSTLTLTNETTILKIPRGAQTEIQSIISWNRSMLAWCCEVNSAADSHLVCEENDGLYSTHVLTRGSTREATGASFVILDGGLKTNSQLQVSVVEDGVAIRVQAEQFRAICEALNSKEPQDVTVKDSGGSQFSIEWVEDDHNSSELYAIRSPIDDLLLEDKFQYGLSLERALTAILEVQTIPGLGVRLSHVYNLHKGRLSPEDEPKVFSIVEMLSRECTSLLTPHLPALISMDITSISLRFYAFQDCVEYDVAPWLGLEDEHAKYRENMDQLLPVLVNCSEFVANGIHVEFTLTFV